MSKEMPIKVFAKKVGIDKKEQEWIEKNEKDVHYYNNSALKNSWISLSYPIYDNDYYFAFINKKARVNAQYNAKANRELRRYIKSFLDKDEIFDKMEKYFAMQFKDAGSGDTMTREELWSAIVDMRKKNPAPKRPTNESNLQEDEMINNQIANLQQRIQANRKRIGYINDVPAHQLGQGEINRRGRLKKSIADLETKIAGLRDKKKKMSQQNNNEEIENVKHNIQFNEFDTMRSMWQKTIDSK